MSASLSYLNAIPSALIAVTPSLDVAYINPAAEALLSVSAQQATGKTLASLPGFDDELCAMCQRVFGTSEEISLFSHTLRVPFNHRMVNMHLTPVIADPASGMSQLLVTIEKADGLHSLDASAWKQEITHAAGVMAAMLAHEVKNPLAGIRGAAQLLKDEVPPDYQLLTELICKETDRIRDLLAQVEIFAAGAPEHKQEVNIHEVLQYVISIAQTGFARHVTFHEKYDPSLPPVLGHRDLLVQLFLNLVKNSAEALDGRQDAAITIATNYRSFYRMRVGATGEKTGLPVAVTIQDNGPGIPETIRAHLFEPFASSKEDGRGLGLAVVAKIASDLGAVVELDKEFEQGTRFTVACPIMARAAKSAAG